MAGNGKSFTASRLLVLSPAAWPVQSNLLSVWNLGSCESDNMTRKCLLNLRLEHVSLMLSVKFLIQNHLSVFQDEKFGKGKVWVLKIKRIQSVEEPQEGEEQGSLLLVGFEGPCQGSWAPLCL